MGVILQAAYRRSRFINGKNILVSVPSPADPETPDADWWYDHIAKQAHELSNVGFTAVLLPPVCKTSSGSNETADGYGIYDDYDIGSKNQFNSIPTRFGTREQLQRACAIFRANGIDVYSDMVPHQRNGGRNGNYTYLRADGKTGGRFSKHPSCFFGPHSQGRVPRDPVAGPVSDDFSFGDELCTVNSTPKEYVLNGLIDAGDWLTKTLDLQGYRIDDTKGQVSSSVLKWATSKSMKGKVSIGEYDDGNPSNLNWWVWESGIGGHVYAFDFAIHYILEAMCNNGSSYDMRQLDHAGLAGISPMQAVTFVENPDTDTDGFATIVWNKILAYAYILTTEGYPMVYYRDYSTDEDCYKLKPGIDNLIWIHENLANGGTIYRWKDFQFVVFERTGEPNLLVGLNNDMYNGWKTVSVQTGFGSNVHLHDYSGHAGDLWTDQNGRLTISIPPNNNGNGYVCYSRAGINPSKKTPPKPTTQYFFGADDLDIGPATPELKSIGRIWCERETEIDIDLAEQFICEIIDANGNNILGKKSTGTVKLSGWHKINIQSKTTTKPFNLGVTYFSTQTLKK